MPVTASVHASAYAPAAGQSPERRRSRRPAELFGALWNLDVSDQARNVTTATLVIHRRDDALIPFGWGRDLAAHIRSVD